MAVEVLLPKLGLTMEEGTVDEWLVGDGEAIEVGTPLLRLATDKIDVDVEAEASGLFHRAVPAGSTLPPGAVIGWVLEVGEAPPGASDPGGSQSALIALKTVSASCSWPATVKCTLSARRRDGSKAPSAVV